MGRRPNRETRDFTEDIERVMLSVVADFSTPASSIRRALAPGTPVRAINVAA
jgi:hypothetical protein